MTPDVIKITVGLKRTRVVFTSSYAHWHWLAPIGVSQRVPRCSARNAAFRPIHHAPSNGIVSQTSLSIYLSLFHVVIFLFLMTKQIVAVDTYGLRHFPVSLLQTRCPGVHKDS